MLLLFQSSGSCVQCSKAMLLLWIIYVLYVLNLLCFRVRLFIDALWSPAGKELTSWLSFDLSNYEVVTFPLVSWVRCGAWLYRFLIFALFHTFFRSQFVWICIVYDIGYIILKWFYAQCVCISSNTVIKITYMYMLWILKEAVLLSTHLNSNSKFKL